MCARLCVCVCVCGGGYMTTFRDTLTRLEEKAFDSQLRKIALLACRAVCKVCFLLHIGLCVYGLSMSFKRVFVYNSMHPRLHYRLLTLCPAAY